MNVLVTGGARGIGAGIVPEERTGSVFRKKREPAEGRHRAAGQEPAPRRAMTNIRTMFRPSAFQEPDSSCNPPPTA